MTSAMIWHGCESSVRPLITGTVMLRHVDQVLRCRCADHDRIDMARQHARRIRDRLTAAELHIGMIEDDRLAAQLTHANIEADARSC